MSDILLYKQIKRVKNAQFCIVNLISYPYTFLTFSKKRLTPLYAEEG